MDSLWIWFRFSIF